MAQTVALQRGTSTVVANATTDLTLFTQSGGTATRVIVNQLTWYFANGVTSRTTNAMISHQSSGGFRSPIFFHVVPSTIAGSWIPGQQDTSMVTIVSTTNSQFANNGVLQSDLTSTGVSQGNLNSGQVSYQTPVNGGFQWGPTNFWIGPSDSLVLRMSASGSLTVNVGWSFTTITES